MPDAPDGTAVALHASMTVLDSLIGYQYEAVV